jgi:hypothetical protein
MQKDGWMDGWIKSGRDKNLRKICKKIVSTVFSKEVYIIMKRLKEVSENRIG